VRGPDHPRQPLPPSPDGRLSLAGLHHLDDPGAPEPSHNHQSRPCRVRSRSPGHVEAQLEQPAGPPGEGLEDTLEGPFQPLATLVFPPLLMDWRRAATYELRTTGATLAAATGAATGATTTELMRRLGHSTPAAALLYQHAAADRNANIAPSLDAMLGPATESQPTIRGGQIAATESRTATSGSRAQPRTANKRPTARTSRWSRLHAGHAGSMPTPGRTAAQGACQVVWTKYWRRTGGREVRDPGEANAGPRSRHGLLVPGTRPARLLTLA
jgi:hypothetical protein